MVTESRSVTGDGDGGKDGLPRATEKVLGGDGNVCFLNCSDSCVGIYPCQSSLRFRCAFLCHRPAQLMGFPIYQGRLGSRLSSAEWFCFVCCGSWDTGNWRQLRVAHQSHNEAVTASGLCLGLLPEKLCKTGSQKLESSGHYCIFFWEMMEWAGTHPWILYNSLKTNT